MFLGDKTLLLMLWALKVVAPCAVAFLKTSNHPAITGMDPGKKDALVSLFAAINGGDYEAKQAMKKAELEVRKIQGE